jgi:hypothetical protein
LIMARRVTDASIADVLDRHVGGPLYGASADARALLAESDGNDSDGVIRVKADGGHG